MLANLAKRKTGAPRTQKTLRSTIKTLIGAQYSEQDVDAVLERLIELGYVKAEGTRISYQLPGDNL